MTRKTLRHKAFEMFRDWTESVLQVNPLLNLTIIDETILFKNLLQTIKSAKTSLKEEAKLNRKIPGYDIGFMSGFINSNLNTTWHADYILKQLVAYKEFIAIKAIKLYFGIEEITRIRVSNLYRNLLLQDLNIAEPNTDIPTEKIKIEGIADTEESYKNEILQMLNNKIYSFINEYIIRSESNYMLPTENYFTKKEILFLLENDVTD